MKEVLQLRTASGIIYFPYGTSIEDNVQDELNRVEDKITALEVSSGTLSGYLKLSDYTDANVLAKIENVDGIGSGLDADLLDGQHSSYFSTSGHVHDDRYLQLTDYTDGNVLTKVKNVDGTGSGLDADLLDGQHSSYFSTSGHVHTSNEVTDIQSTITNNSSVSANTFSRHDKIHNINSIENHSGVVGATQNNFISFDENGLPKDSGYSNTSFSTSGHIHDERYYTQAQLTSGQLDSQYVKVSDYEDLDVLAKIKNVDGTGSGLDADLWDGNQFSDYLNQNVSSGQLPTFSDVYISSLNRNFQTVGSDTKMVTGVPFDERGKFKVAFTYSAPNIVATISFVGANTSFSYYINGKKFTVTAAEISAYTANATASEGIWFFYINQSTTDAATPVISLTKNPWNIYDPDVLLWNAFFEATGNTIYWVGEERHTAGRDIYNHARNHAQGAIYKIGLTASQYNGLTNFSSNTNNNFGRAQIQIVGGAFFDEDIQNSITHTDASISSTTAVPATNWNLTVSQFLGFTAIADTGTTTTSIVFPSSRTLVTGQAITVMAGNTTTVRETTTITTGGTGTTFTVTLVTGLAAGDAIVVGARIPVYYVSAVSGSNYTWRRLTTTDFVGVSGGAAVDASTIASAAMQYNNATAGGFASVTSGRYFPVYLLATNTTSEPVIAILGQGQSSSATLATALGEAVFQFQNLAGLSNLGIQEVVPFYRLTFNYNSTPSFNANRMRLVDVTFLNVRVATVTGAIFSGGSSVTSASSVNTDTTNFNGILSTADTTAQAAYDTIDNHTHTHNSTTIIQGGTTNEYYHLTSGQLTNATQLASGSTSGILSSTDWTDFDSKQDA